MAKIANFRAESLAPLSCLLIMGLAWTQLTQAADFNDRGHNSGTMYYSLHGKPITKNQYQAIMIYNEAYKALQGGNYNVALEKLQQSLALDPDQYQAKTKYGFVLAKLGHVDEGIHELEQAIQLEPNLPEAICTIGSIYQTAGQLKEAIAAYSTFLKKFPHDPVANNVRSIQQQLQAEYAREQSVASSSADGGNADDYFGYATYEAITKWPAGKFPLKVFIPSEQEAARIPHYDKRFGMALKRAFDTWATKSNGTISFKFVNSPADANIECVWTADAHKVSSPAEGGEAHVQYDSSNGIDHAQIILLTHFATLESRQTPLNTVAFACLHEIGHSLGIIGHSPDAADVMYCSLPTTDRSWELSERDTKTLVHLYQPEIQVAFHEQAASTGGTDKISFNNDGVRFAMAGNFVQARQKFEAALKMDPSYEPSKRNLASCLNTLALEAASQQNYNLAADLLKRTVDLQKNEPDLEKRLAVLHNYANILQYLNRQAEVAAVRLAIAKLTPGEASYTSMKQR